MSDKNIKDLDEVTKGYFNVPIEGNEEADEVWNTLFLLNHTNLKDKAHSLFHKGIEELSLSPKNIPKLSDLQNTIFQKTGWTLVPTDNEYSGAEDWFFHLVRKSFPVTKVIRSRENLHYTPYPEAFHDIFGHMPFMCFPEYMNLVEKAAKVYLSLDSQEKKEEFWSFWWYTVEFGLMKEDGEIKAFGAGFMSSFAECNHAFSDKVTLVPFNVKEMRSTPISDHNLHNKFFVIESLNQIEEALDNWD